MKPPLSTRGFKVRPEGDAKCRDIVWKSKNVFYTEEDSRDFQSHPSNRSAASGGCAAGAVMVAPQLPSTL